MGVITALQFITLAVLARLLSPADFGLMGMVMVVIGFAQAFADMGISNAIIHRQDATREQLSSLYWLNIFSGVVVFFLVCVSTPLIVEFYHEQRLSNLLYLTALVFLITPFGQQFQILLQKELKFNGLAKIEITHSLVHSVTAIGAALLGYGVYSLIYGQLAATSVRVALLCGIGWRYWRPSIHFSKQDLKGYVSFGLYQMGERSINYLNSNLDYLLIGAMLGAKELGYYTLAYNLVIRPSSMINPVITKVAFPVFSRIQHETEKLRRGYLKVLQLLSIVNFPMMTGLAVVASVAVPVIFGDQWLPSVILIKILAIFGLIRSTVNPIGALLLAKGRADLGFKWNLSITVIIVPVIYIGAKFGGAVGVATALTILTTVSFTLHYPILICTMIGPCLRDFAKSMWPALWMSMVMAMAVVLVSKILGAAPNSIIFAVQVMLGAIFYVWLVLQWQRPIVNEIRPLFRSSTSDR